MILEQIIIAKNRTLLLLGTGYFSLYLRSYIFVEVVEGCTIQINNFYFTGTILDRFGTCSLYALTPSDYNYLI